MRNNKKHRLFDIDQAQNHESVVSNCLNMSVKQIVINAVTCSHNYKIKALVLICLILTGCASVNSSSHTNNIDPLEPYNKRMYHVNEFLDKTMLRPMAVFYVNYIPYPVRYGVNNFFNNLRDVVSLANNIIQLDPINTIHTFMRISVNSVIGVAGLVDVSSSMGLPSYRNSFGQTFQHYGWSTSSYLVLPLFGPSTVRDGLGLIPDTYFNPTWYLIHNYYISTGLFATNVLNHRSQLLGFDTTLEQSSINPYITVRNLYLQSIGQLSESNDNIDINDLVNEESAP